MGDHEQIAEVTISGVLTKADGTVIDLGELAHWSQEDDEGDS